MKIGFFARTLMITEKYWDKLQDKADCWWGVTQEPLHDALRDRNHTKIAFHYEKQIVDKNKKFGNQLVAMNPGESENRVAQMIDPDLWITESLNKLNYVPKKVPWIQIFHSIPIKKHFFYQPVLEYDLMLLPGEYHKQELIQRLGLRANDKRLKVVGWPRIDDFFNNVFEREAIMSGLGLDINCKTLMYAPTWGWGYGNEAFFARWFGREVEIFERLCYEVKQMGLNFIVKLHSLSFYANNKEMINIANKHGVLWLTKETSGFQEDPNRLLWITDILISDLSGIIADFLVLDRPVIYIDPDDNLDVWNGADMPKSFRVGHVVKTPDELINGIDDSVSYPEKFKDKRQDLVSKLFYSPDGKAIDRAVEEILSFTSNKLSFCQRL